MRCKDLFKNDNVIFVPAEENLQRQESQIATYANYHGFKIDISLGLWVNAATATAERVLRLELVGMSNKPRYKSRDYKPRLETIKKREDLIEKIKKLLKEGKTQSEIARIYNCSRQKINAFVRYHNIDESKL